MILYVKPRVGLYEFSVTMLLCLYYCQWELSQNFSLPNMNDCTSEIKYAYLDSISSLYKILTIYFYVFDELDFFHYLDVILKLIKHTEK